MHNQTELNAKTTALLKRVRRIEIKARRLSNEVFAGKYHSAFRGRGMAFSEVREYEIGDDIRDIDWNVTARYAHPYVKIFEEERELTVMLMVDMSGSQAFGTESEQKQELATEIAATLAFSALQNNDKVGAILFTDTVEKFIPPRSGKHHVLYIIRELLGFTPKSSSTNISASLTFLHSIVKKRCTAFLISDFIDNADRYRRSLTVAAARNDLVAIRVYDRHDILIPRMGLVRLRDAESGKELWVDTSRRAVQRTLCEYAERTDHEREALFRQCGVDNMSVHTGEDYVPRLAQVFKHRS